MHLGFVRYPSNLLFRTCGFVVLLALVGCQAPAPGPSAKDKARTSRVEKPRPVMRAAKPSPAVQVKAPAKRPPVEKKRPNMLQDPVVASEKKDVAPIGDVIRICSYNIQDMTDGENDGPYRTAMVVNRHLDSAARVISELRPDILLLQEVENEKVVSGINERLPDPLPVVYVSNFDEGRRGTKRNVAVLSRYKVAKVREIDFAGAESPVHLSRGTIAAAFNLDRNHLLLVYVVHLKSNYGKKEGRDEENIAKRKEALKLIRAHAELVMESNPSKQWEVVIAGDMNVDPELDSFSHDTSLDPVSDWHDLWTGRPLAERITIPTRHGDPELEFPSACFDRIVVSPALKEKPWAVEEIQVLQRGVDTENVFTSPGQNEINVSDHYPVFVDIVR